MSSKNECTDTIEVTDSISAADSNLLTLESPINRDSFLSSVNPEQNSPTVLLVDEQILSLQGGELHVNWKKSRRDCSSNSNEPAMEDKTTKSKASQESYPSEDSMVFSDWSNFSSNEMYSNSSEGLTCVMSELNIFRRSSSFSKNKIKEIKEFYKNKLLKSGAVVGKPVRSTACGSSDEGFKLLMKSKMTVVASESLFPDSESLRSDSIGSPSSGSGSNEKQSVVSQHSLRSNTRTPPQTHNSSGLFSQLSNLFASLLGRNSPRNTRSCSLEVCESEYEPLRRCHKAMDVRKAIHN